jgi:hypothetical protein
MNEPLVVDPKKCGIGQGEHCCAFLIVGANFECGREDPGIAAAILGRLAAGTFTAKYSPGDLAYPECQPFPES